MVWLDDKNDLIRTTRDSLLAFVIVAAIFATVLVAGLAVITVIRTLAGT